jgi:hypothetical protein
MCIVLKGQDGVIEQARRQLEDLVIELFGKAQSAELTSIGTRMGRSRLHQHSMCRA